ncbi:MAG: hypothetical protein WC812_03095 [Candidatus Pacearchaeota archaeon]|jgi:hypothetical protein
MEKTLFNKIKCLNISIGNQIEISLNGNDNIKIVGYFRGLEKQKNPCIDFLFYSRNNQNECQIIPLPLDNIIDVRILDYKLMNLSDYFGG